MPSCNSSERVPPEIWQDILQTAISAPLFFSIDPANEYGIHAVHDYGDASAYWESERTRNALRRVCKSWDAYLRRFEHRFIHLVDVEHGAVPLFALRNATRIQMASCLCRRRTVNLKAARRDLLDHIREDGTPENWKLRILVGFWEDEPVEKHSHILLSPNRLAHLRVFLTGSSSHDVWTIINGTERTERTEHPLTFCWPSIRPIDIDLLDTSNLTTLSLSKWHRSEGKWPMPHLRHLKLDFFAILASITSLCRWLRIIGPQLQSFAWSGGPGVAMDVDFWELCPNVTTLRISDETKLRMPPPPGHPIQNLGLPVLEKYGHCDVCWDRHDSYDASFPSIMEIASAGIRRVELTTVWTHNAFPTSRCGEYAKSTAETCIHDQARSHGVELVDAYSKTFEELVIELIELRLKIRSIPKQRLGF